MYFSIEGEELLKKYNDICNQVNSSVKNELNSELIYKKKYLKTKIKSYSGRAIDFDDKEMPKVGSNYICLVVILTDFILKKDENYYPQVFLKKCKQIEKEKKGD